MLRIRRRPAKTLEVVDHWAPDADCVSLALNHDGSLLSAASAAGVARWRLYQIVMTGGTKRWLPRAVWHVR